MRRQPQALSSCNERSDERSVDGTELAPAGRRGIRYSIVKQPGALIRVAPDFAFASSGLHKTCVIAPWFVRLQGAPVVVFRNPPRRRAEHRAFHRARGAICFWHMASHALQACESVRLWKGSRQWLRV